MERLVFLHARAMVFIFLFHAVSILVCLKDFYLPPRLLSWVVPLLLQYLIRMHVSFLAASGLLEDKRLSSYLPLLTSSTGVSTSDLLTVPFKLCMFLHVCWIGGFNAPA